MKTVIRVAISAVIMGCLLVGFYFYLSHVRPAGQKEEKAPKQTELEKVLSKDFSTDFPATPRETVKWYNRIVMLYYDENTPEKQIGALCDQAMMLFDPELLEQNPRDVYIASVKKDIEEFRVRGKHMAQTDVCDTNDVQYTTKNGEKLAYVLAYYFVSENTDYQQTYQKFVLRRDENHCWRILGFQLTDEDGNAK